MMCELQSEYWKFSRKDWNARRQITRYLSLLAPNEMASEKKSEMAWKKKKKKSQTKYAADSNASAISDLAFSYALDNLEWSSL